MMNEKKFFNKTILAVVIVLNLLLFIYASIAKINHWPFSNFFLGLSTGLFVGVWIYILTDIFKQRIYNKTFWIISMFIIPQVTSLFYVFQRDKLKRLGNKF